MEEGRFAYRESLERVRKQLLDSADTQFATPDASQQVQRATQGLMRPRSRPESEAPSEGFGMGIIRGLQRVEEERVAASAPESSPRPRARPGSVSATDMEDREILALTLQAEAGGEGLDGMIAAGSVIRNRADSGNYGDGIRGVIMKAGQFSAWNLETGYAGGEGGIDMASLRASEEAYIAADKLLSGDYTDQTGGATHYYNPEVATPAWGSNTGGEWTDIGRHRFGFGDGRPGSN
tara:strand:- start:2134 stop:2841 length:708 start_codon:yes stop_codon:yes gene_type:complete